MSWYAGCLLHIALCMLSYNFCFGCHLLHVTCCITPSRSLFLHLTVCMLPSQSLLFRLYLVHALRCQLLHALKQLECMYVMSQTHTANQSSTKLRSGHIMANPSLDTAQQVVPFWAQGEKLRKVHQQETVLHSSLNKVMLPGHHRVPVMQGSSGGAD